MNLVQLKPVLALTTLATLSLAPCAVPAEEKSDRVYECKQGDNTVFSGQPCGPQDRQVTVDYDQPSAAQTQQAVRKDRAEESAAAAAAEADILDNEILDAQDAISRLEAERDMKVAELRQQSFAGTEQLDVNAWQAQMDAKIESVVQGYADRIAAANDRLTALRARREALGVPAPTQQ
jgi:hypothetical protein